MGNGCVFHSSSLIQYFLKSELTNGQECPSLDPEDVSWMDQDLYETDEAETLRVRLASSSTSTSKMPSRAAHPYPADADMDVLSLVRYPSKKIHFKNQITIFYTYSRTVCAPTSNKTMRHMHNA